MVGGWKRRVKVEVPLKPGLRGKLSRLIGFDKKFTTARRRVPRKIEGTAKMQNWNSSLGEVESNLGHNLREVIAGLGKKPVIVDFGCGSGQAVTRLAQLFPGGKFYGYSREFSEEWPRIVADSKNLKFVHSSNESFFRYFRNGSVDFIYSNKGLYNLFSYCMNPRLKEAAWSYIWKQVLPKLRIGGVLISDVEKTDQLTPEARRPFDTFLRRLRQSNSFTWETKLLDDGNRVVIIIRRIRGKNRTTKHQQ